MPFVERLEVIQYSGHTSKKRNILLLGDGFLPEHAPFFEMLTEALTERLFRIHPFHLLRGYFNVFRYFAPSKEEGIGALGEDWLLAGQGGGARQQKLFQGPIPNGYTSVGHFPRRDTALGLVHDADEYGNPDLAIDPDKADRLYKLIRGLNAAPASSSAPSPLFDEGSSTHIPQCWLEAEAYDSSGLLLPPTPIGDDAGLVVVLANTDYDCGVSATRAERVDPVSMKVDKIPLRLGRVSLVSVGREQTFDIGGGLKTLADNVTIGGVSVPRLDLSPSVTRQVKGQIDYDAGVNASVVAHEVGHSFFELDNEYGRSEISSSPTGPNLVDAPAIPNIGTPTFDVEKAWGGSGNKELEYWGEHIHESVRAWMRDYSSPLYSFAQAEADDKNMNIPDSSTRPTPPVAPTAGSNAATAKAALQTILAKVDFPRKLVGLYAGAGENLNLYRPTGNCKMRSTGEPAEQWRALEFCYVCMVEIVKKAVAKDPGKQKQLLAEIKARYYQAPKDK